MAILIKCKVCGWARLTTYPSTPKLGTKVQDCPNCDKDGNDVLVVDLNYISDKGYSITVEELSKHLSD